MNFLDLDLFLLVITEDSKRQWGKHAIYSGLTRILMGQNKTCVNISFKWKLAEYWVCLCLVMQLKPQIVLRFVHSCNKIRFRGQTISKSWCHKKDNEYGTIAFYMKKNAAQLVSFGCWILPLAQKKSCNCDKSKTGNVVKCLIVSNHI